jgi:hypothetical protein
VADVSGAATGEVRIAIDVVEPWRFTVNGSVQLRGDCAPAPAAPPPPPAPPALAPPPSAAAPPADALPQVVDGVWPRYVG